MKFAMIRLGYGSADGSACGLDGWFERNVQRAVKAGVEVGCYFYSYATSVTAANKEAAFVVSVLQKYKGVFTYPAAFDLEDKTQQNLGKTVLTDMVIAFGDAIEKAGFYCSLYSNLDWLKNRLDDSRLKRFDHWLAQWASAPTYDGAFGMWQNSSKDSVNGISGNVDTDVAYKDYPAVIKGAKLNGFTSSDQKPSVPAQPEEPDPQPSSSFRKGDLVKITGTKYYSGKTIPAWVKAKNWYVLQADGAGGRYRPKRERQKRHLQPRERRRPSAGDGCPAEDRGRACPRGHLRSVGQRSRPPQPPDRRRIRLRCRAEASQRAAEITANQPLSLWAFRFRSACSLFFCFEVKILPLFFDCDLGGLSHE